MRSGSEVVRSWILGRRGEGCESGSGVRGGSSDVRGRPANARGADILEIMFPNVL